MRGRAPLMAATLVVFHPFKPTLIRRLKARGFLTQPGGHLQIPVPAFGASIRRRRLELGLNWPVQRQ
jgi:hypothetical protein